MNPNHTPYRLAVLTSHPIQYQVPLFRALASRPDIELTVYFCSDWGLKTYYDKGFGQDIKWDIPLLNGYHYEFLPNKSPKPNVSKFWGLINPKIIRCLRNGKFDALWVHGWSQCTIWIAMISAMSSGIPVLLRGESNFLSVLPLWKRILKKCILIRLFKRVSAFLAIGRYNTEFYLAYGIPKEKIFRVPYTVDNEFFMSKAQELLPQKNESKQKLGVPEEMPIVLFAGKLVDIKRPKDLLDAFAVISKEIKAALIYAGDGPLRTQIEAYTQASCLQNVFFVGFQNQSELPKFYAMADVLVLPSEFEPWGLVVNEAMCFGLPVITSDLVGAHGDLVKEGLNGFIYPCGDIAALVERLKYLLTNKNVRLKMGEASRELITRWSYRETLQGILSCIKRTAAH